MPRSSHWKSILVLSSFSLSLFSISSTSSLSPRASFSPDSKRAPISFSLSQKNVSKYVVSQLFYHGQFHAIMRSALARTHFLIPRDLVYFFLRTAQDRPRIEMKLGNGVKSFRRRTLASIEEATELSRLFKFSSES